MSTAALFARDHSAIPAVAVAQCTKDIDWTHVDLRVFSTDKAPATGRFALPASDPAALASRTVGSERIPSRAR